MKCRTRSHTSGQGTKTDCCQVYAANNLPAMLYLKLVCVFIFKIKINQRIVNGRDINSLSSSSTIRGPRDRRFFFLFFWLILEFLAVSAF